ncbi:hypothetical protein ACFPMF_06570 [Larkinella bovis]|uniref:Uncharacterized protein n=1 Tax=Larkinella bovis TaxID=683041 RepID=A0ABW0I8U6_9BACT
MLLVTTIKGYTELYFGNIKEVKNNFIYFEVEGIQFHLNLWRDHQFNIKFKKIKEWEIDRVVFMFSSCSKPLKKEIRSIDKIFIVAEKNSFIKYRFMELTLADLQKIAGATVNKEKKVNGFHYVITAPFIRDLIKEFLEFYNDKLEDNSKEIFKEFDIDKYADNYEVSHKIQHTYRPGGDDWCWTHIRSNFEIIATDDYLRSITPKIDISERYNEYNSGYQWKDIFIDSAEHKAQINQAYTLTEDGRKIIIDIYDSEKHFMAFFAQKVKELVRQLELDICSRGEQNVSKLYFPFIEYVEQRNKFKHLDEDYSIPL